MNTTQEQAKHRRGMKVFPTCTEQPEQRQEVKAYHYFTDNIESLAIAIIMALMLKFFLVEAYKIPTGSMQPTIMGNEETGILDRVLVNKFIYLVSEPKRWDVIVFKYPLDQSKNYIKRLVGLPGEEISIWGGDIYVNGAIERKPEEALCAQLKELYPDKGANGTFTSYFRTKGECRISEPDRVVFLGPGSVSTRRTIRAGYLDGYDPDYGIPNERPSTQSQPVGDIRVAFTATLDSAKGGVFARIREEDREHTFFLRGGEAAEPSYIATGRRVFSEVEEAEGWDIKKVWIDADLSLAAGRAYEIVFTNIDDRLTIHLDGELIACSDYVSKTMRFHDRDNSLEFGLRDGPGTFDGIKVWRDIYYTSGSRSGKSTYQVPEDHYFALGDNTQNSADSRAWDRVVFKLKNGELVRGNYEPRSERNPTPIAGGYILKDIYGNTRVLENADLREIRYTLEKTARSINKYSYQEPAHFIHKKLMLGKAMMVFWPIYPYFRWKLLR